MNAKQNYTLNDELMKIAPEMYKQLRIVEVELMGWLESQDIPDQMGSDMLDRQIKIHETIEKVHATTEPTT